MSRPAGSWPRATPSWWTSAAPCRAATARTAPGPTSSAQPPPDFAAYYQVLKRGAGGRLRRRPAGGPRGGRGRRGAGPDQRGRATGSTSSTGPGTGSAWRRTRTPTSCPATRRHCCRGWPSRWNRGSIPGPHGARIEDIVVCTPDGCERLNNASQGRLVIGGRRDAGIAGPHPRAGRQGAAPAVDAAERTAAVPARGVPPAGQVGAARAALPGAMGRRRPALRGLPAGR